MAQYIDTTKDGHHLSGMSGDEIAERYAKERAEMERREHSRMLQQIDQNIAQLDKTIKQLEGQRNPPSIMGDLHNQRDALIRKKVELTNGSQLQDAVSSTREDDVDAFQKGEISPDELQQREQERGLKKPTFHQTYKYEELFQENIDGDLIMTFPPEVMEACGLKEGDTLGISSNANGLVFKKL